MSSERMRLFLKSWPVNCEMASLATIDARDRLIETVSVELIERDLLNLGNLVEGERTEFEGRILHHPDPLIALASELANFVLDLFAARSDLFYFLFELIAFHPRRFELFFQFRFAFVEFGNFVQIRFRIAFLLDGVIMLVPGF